MNKKIWFNGAVYDLATLTESDIKTDLEERIAKQIGVSLDVDVTINELNNMVVIRIRRGLNGVDLMPGCIYETDEWLISGECQNFQPQFRTGLGVPRFPGLQIFEDINDVKSRYKQNSAFYGASKRFKGIDIIETPVDISMYLRF